MKERLTKSEVEHVAKLAKIHLSEEEKEVYAVTLQELLSDVNHILDVPVKTDECLIAPVHHEATLESDEAGEMISLPDVKNGVPHVKGNFVEVPVMVRE
jgi:aspartyl-tRNA(Asn)/glutamyl-tRNA(Gln) amidotransferase subunit C